MIISGIKVYMFHV